jgi:hypothetical protein
MLITNIQYKLKKSAKGLLCVTADHGAHGVTGFTLHEDVPMYHCGADRYFEGNGALEVIFENGKAGYTQTLSEIRTRLARG